MGGNGDRRLRFGEYELDFRSEKLLRDGRPVKIQPQPLRVLAVLAEHRGEIVSREQLRERIWGAATFVEFDQGLNYCIRQIRVALRDEASKPAYVETLPKQGYRFIASVTGPEPQDAEHSIANAGTELTVDLGRPRFRWKWAVAMVALVLIMGTIGWRMWPRADSHHIRSIAVLPLRNNSRDPDQQYFADGMTEALTTGLAQLSELTVIAKTSVMRYQGTQKSTPDIARELNVDAVVEGSVQRSDDHCLCRAVHHLSVHDLSREFSHERSLSGAVSKAIELDDGSAAAHVSLGFLLENHDWNWTEAERELKRAIQLNPNLAEAHYWYSVDLRVLGRLDEAIAESARGVQLSPYSRLANLFYAQHLIYAGQFPKALEQARKMLDFAPNAAHNVMGLAYEQMGDLNMAIAEFQREVNDSKRNFTSLANLAHAYAVAGDKPQALKLLAELQDLSKRRPVDSFEIAIVYAGLGDKDRAFELLDKGYDERPSGLPDVKADPRMNPLRSDSRYHELLLRMGLPE